VADFIDMEWIETACARMTVPENFTSRWCAVLRDSGIYRHCPKTDAPNRQTNGRTVVEEKDDDDDINMENDSQGGG
jgi:hypothetical protein